MHALPAGLVTNRGVMASPRSVLVQRMFGWVLGALACSDSDDSAAVAAAATAAMYNCENRIDAARPCPGLLPACPAPGPNLGSPGVTYDPEHMLVVGLTDCVGEHFHERATIGYVGSNEPGYAPGFGLGLESGCAVGITAEASVEDVERGPAWLRLAVGQEVDVEVWHARGLRAGGSWFWITLRNLDTSELIFTFYHNDWQLIEQGMVSDLLGFDVAITAPTCEERYGPDNGGVLSHRHSLRVQTALSAVTLGMMDVEALSLEDGRRIRVQNTYCAYLYGLLPDVGSYTPFLGPEVTFSAWPE